MGLSILTSEGLGGLLQLRAISPVMKAHSSGARGLLDSGDIARASLNVWRSTSAGSGDDSTGVAVPGGGEMFLGRGEDLNEKKPLKCHFLSLNVNVYVRSKSNTFTNNSWFNWSDYIARPTGYSGFQNT